MQAAFGQVAWANSWTEAQQLAVGSQRQILLVFAGSDWCRPCMQLEQEVFATPFFQALSQKHLVAYKADFPRRKKNRLPPSLQQQHEALAARYNPEGAFPYVLLLDPEGEILARLGYQPGGPQAYWQALQAQTAPLTH